MNLTGNIIQHQSRQFDSSYTGGKRHAFFIKSSIDAVTGAAKGAASVVERTTRPFRGAARVLVAPFTVPTKVAIWGAKKTNEYIIKPAANLTDAVGGTAKEAGLGLWTATGHVAWDFAKRPLIDVKMNAYDLPLHIMREGLSYPTHFIKAPFRSIQGLGEAFVDIPKNTMAIINNTRENTKSLLDNIVHLRPIESVKSFARLGRDGIKDILVNPAKSALKPITKPIEPMTRLPFGAVSIAAGSKLQYLRSFPEAKNDLVTGVSRMINAPGHRLHLTSLDQLQGKKVAKKVDPEKAKKEASNNEEEAKNESQKKKAA